tara:strand:- start:229 stop:486 length:258 start_codon:yes stop_codon:yes gene_type:complete
MNNTLIYRSYDIHLSNSGYKILLDNKFILEKTIDCKNLDAKAKHNHLEYLARCDIDSILKEQIKKDNASIQRVDAQVKGPNYGKL